MYKYGKLIQGNIIMCKLKIVNTYSKKLQKFFTFALKYLKIYIIEFMSVNTKQQNFKPETLDPKLPDIKNWQQNLKRFFKN